MNHAQRIEAAVEAFENDADACRARRELLAARAKIKALEVVLHKIAYEPFGPSEASHRDILEDITQLARQTLAGNDGYQWS